MLKPDIKTKLVKTKSLDPYFVTGLVEAEGSFSITKHKDKRAKYDINLGLAFRITMLNNEVELLNMVKDYFGCGYISIDDKLGSLTFNVRDINSITKIIIPHFYKYPLRGTKYSDFLSFKEALDLINLKEHLTEEGIDKISEISMTMNLYRKFLVEYSPNHTLEKSSDYIPIDGNYINGFIAGDGCLAFNTKDKNFARMSLQITQHKHNKLLLLSIAKYFKSPSKVYYHETNSLQLTLAGIKI